MNRWLRNRITGPASSDEVGRNMRALSRREREVAARLRQREAAHLLKKCHTLRQVVGKKNGHHE